MKRKYVEKSVVKIYETVRLTKYKNKKSIPSVKYQEGLFSSL